MVLLLKEISVKVLGPVRVILLRLDVGISPLLSSRVIPEFWQVAIVVVREAGVALLEDLVLKFLGNRANAIEVWKRWHITATTE
jgi:hypothetical protein